MLKDWVSEVPEVKQTTYASKKRQNIKKLTKINKTKLFLSNILCIFASVQKFKEYQKMNKFNVLKADVNRMEIAAKTVKMDVIDKIIKVDDEINVDLDTLDFLRYELYDINVGGSSIYIDYDGDARVVKFIIRNTTLEDYIIKKFKPKHIRYYSNFKTKSYSMICTLDYTPYQEGDSESKKELYEWFKLNGFDASISIENGESTLYITLINEEE